MFDSDADFERAVRAGVITKPWIARIWGRNEADIVLVALPQARAIKFSFPRRPIQGDPGEMDQYAGQQYAPLLDLEIACGVRGERGRFSLCGSFALARQG